LRHAYARMLRRSGYPIEQISKMLGHRNITVTQNIYLDFRDDEVVEAAQAFTMEKVSKK
jgi:integrase